MNSITTSHEIPANKLSGLEEIIAKLNRRAKRLALPLIALKVIGEPRVEIRTVHGTETQRVWITVEVTGAEPKVEGWQFVATFEHDGETNLTIIRRNPTFTGDIPARYRSVHQSCEHCNVNRARKDTFLLFNGTEYKQIGRNCLRAFIGYGDPHQYATACEIWSDLGDYFDGSSGDNEGEGWGGSGNFAVSLDHYVARCFAVTRVYGFIGRVKAREIAKQATADRALDYIFPTNEQRQDKEWKAEELATRPTAQDIERTTAALEWVRGFDITGNLSEYLHNLFVACASEVFVSRRAGLVASLPAAYLKHIERAEELRKERESRPESNYQGKVGERLRNLRLTVKNIFASEGQFGVTYITKFEDALGNCFTWFASGTELNKGDTYKVTGTVKEHSEYKGQKCTVLSRCDCLEVFPGYEDCEQYGLIIVTEHAGKHALTRIPFDTFLVSNDKKALVKLAKVIKFESYAIEDIRAVREFVREGKGEIVTLPKAEGVLL